MGEQPAQHTPSSHVIPHRQHMLLHGTVTLPPPVAQAVALFTVVVGDVRSPTAWGSRYRTRGWTLSSKSRFHTRGRATLQKGRDALQLRGHRPLSVCRVRFSPHLSLHAYLAGQISFARASQQAQAHTFHFPGHVVLSPGWARSAMLPLEPARPPVTALLSQPGGTAVWSSHHSWHAALSQDRGPVLLPISRIMLPEFRGCLVAKGTQG